MSELLAWSLTAGAPGGSMDGSGSLEVEALTTASVTVAKASSADLAFQLSDVAKVSFFALTSSSYEGDVKVKGPDQNDAEVALTGPLILFGAAVTLLSASLATLKVTNDHPDQAVEIEVLLGQKLTA